MRRVSLPEDRNNKFEDDTVHSEAFGNYKNWRVPPVISTFRRWRVFINHIDSYHGKKLADYLMDRVFVNPRSADDELGEEEEDEEEEDENVQGEETIEEDDKPRRPIDTQEETLKYEVIGTTLDPEYPMPEDVTKIIKDTKNRDVLLKELMNCGIVIYDITGDKGQVEEAQWALKAIIQELEKIERTTPKAFQRNDEMRYFILISTLLTWANTKPLSPDEPDLPFTEEDYRKRKPHPNFKKHVQCEKDVVIVKKKFNLKDKLKTLVICAGATYGDEQGPLQYLFRMAWKNTAFLPIFGKGNNKIPLLYVHDLIAVIADALQNWPPLGYIVAMEQELISQSTIVKKISRALTTGKVKNIEQEEAFLIPDVTQQIYDLMTMNLNIDPEYIVDRISWLLNMPFSDSINTIVKEFRAARNLRPLKIIVLGPPASGKTRVAEYLMKHYDLHYIQVKALIQSMIHHLTSEIENATAEENKPGEMGGGDDADEDEDVEEEEEEESPNIEELQELLEEIEHNMQRNKGRLDDPILTKLFRRKLRSKECQNQGYIIDGYPKTLQQAKELFAAENLDEMEEEVDEEAELDDGSAYTIMPELVLSLEASDDFLKERIIQRPEWEVQGTHYTEEHMIRRLKEYRNRNTDENTPLQFFDEIEIHPLFIDIEDDVCPDMFPTIYQCLERLGPARTYGLTAEEAKEARKRAEAEAHAAETAQRLQQDKEMLEHKRQREEKMLEWTTLMEKLMEERQERLSLMALPLRNYLVKYIFPTLTEGLIEVANLRPDDPIDFLAEYLFKENPEGKMFHPDYTRAMNSILDVIEQYQNEILPPYELSDRIIEFLRRDSEQNGADSVTTSASSEMDVCTGKKATMCVTPSFTYDDIDAFGEGEGEGDFGSDQCDGYNKHDTQ